MAKRKKQKQALEVVEAAMKKLVKKGKKQSLNFLKTIGIMSVVFNLSKTVKEKDVEGMLGKISPKQAGNKRLVKSLHERISSLRKERFAFEKKQKRDLGQIFKMVK